ncbi:hypothetical protein [Pelagibaculum spongiae]|uniref:Uncharacterized protein n=1 Tax=Pelagibaculum spongiae TaxID=2080658 RepID=A0A2V1GZQ4_9GAMM|nr:hypothetical protein [Pelagibaculum spongiae]PVZ72534.1 hypothetical protein DC094_05920 [Pelagibaculum spongiae]
MSETCCVVYLWLPGRKYSAAPKGFAADNVAEGSRHKNAALSQHSSLLQLFPSGEFDREKMELAFHENLLHQALGMKAVDMNWKLQIDFQDNQGLFMMEMAQQLKRQLSSAKSDIERLLPVEAQDSTPWRINLSGLNEQAMLDAWLQIKGKSNGHYRIFRKNCATVVHRVLAAGGADQLAGWSASHAGVWTPGRLFNYCMKVQGRSVMSAA